MKTIRGIICLLQISRAILHIVLWKISPVRAVIEKDMERWLQLKNYPEKWRLPRWRGLGWLLWRFPEFRNLFYYRISGEERTTSKVLMGLARFLYRPMDTLYIYTPSIGAGLFIAHGFCTIISAESIGQNCWITHQVSVGQSNGAGSPTIGDCVTIMPGAKVFGNITIGNNSIIGANAVVFKDVPPNCTVVGVPAYIVRCDGEKVRKPL